MTHLGLARTPALTEYYASLSREQRESIRIKLAKDFDRLSLAIKAHPPDPDRVNQPLQALHRQRRAVTRRLQCLKAARRQQHAMLDALRDRYPAIYRELFDEFSAP